MNGKKHFHKLPTVGEKQECTFALVKYKMFRETNTACMKVAKKVDFTEKSIARAQCGKLL